MMPILEYRRCDPPPGLREAVATAIRATALDDAPFCAEMRYERDRWVLIELYARLGEDDGLAQKMWDSCPLQAIERATERLDCLAESGIARRGFRREPDECAT